QLLLDVRCGVGPVELIQVDVVSLETPKGVLHLLEDPETGVPALVPPRSHLAVNLRRENDVVAPPLQRAADDLLGLSPGVDVGRVAEVDAGGERRVDDADALVLIGVSPRAEHHRAETEGADLDSRPAERAVLHPEAS